MQNAILVFTANVDKWGAERSITSMCAGLQSRGHKVLVIIPKHGPIHELLEAVNVEYMIFPYSTAIVGPSYYELPLWRRFVRKRYLFVGCFKYLLSLCRLKKILKERNINPIAVYSATITIDFGAHFAKYIKVPHIQHIRENLSAFGYRLRKGNEKGLRFIKKNSVAVICTCNAIRDYYQKSLYLESTYVVNNGVPSIDLPQMEKSKDILMLIQTTRLMSDKNVIESIKAVEQLVKSGCDKIQLDIYGVGEQEEDLKEYIETHNLSSYIEMKGFCDDINYFKYHVGLMTSVFEAFARSTIEYMNHGLAVVASNTGGNLEQIVDGETGFFYELNNPNDLARILRMLYENPLLTTKLGKAGKKRFDECFTQERYVKQITDIIIAKIK